MAIRPRGTTLFDVARAAGVSKSTAARVLAGEGSASAQAVEKVKKAAADLGYTPNAIAKAMVSGSSHTIGILVPDVASAFFAAVVRGFTDTARAAGFEVMLGNTDRTDADEDRSLEVFIEHRVAGIALAPHNRAHSAPLARLIDRGFPLVMLDRPTPAAPGADVVGLDHAAAGALATEHLLDQGHRAIAVVVSDSTRIPRILADAPADRLDDEVLRPDELRLLGYVRALRAHGLQPDPELVVEVPYTPQEAQEAVRDFLTGTRDAGSAGTAPAGSDGTPTATSATALLCTDSLMSTAGYRALIDAGIAYPDDMSFLAFDDQDWCTMVRPAVSVIAQPDVQLGQQAASALIARIRGDRAGAKHTELAAQLMVRGSTARPPAHSLAEA
ncbi:LacI family transcriptional regulator [Brevibacterium sp. 50QC2O2]|uniref:LacI family DNA-binding transcriptional regulator n=1 Tax=unclassified Brevibacterium TaxID=2614124 RepID=UPI00211CD5F4|nr:MULTISPECIES: LacI family DNA-binding transcriptional regulator [unclassified Brevibacterium]MCQ9368730.1 LacI family transcriptional regulator [Brevibacterium sp. 91QC2O2]MCQ9389811.1 LacI family transcriptional regulator [Brevibacterium sp. 50QC2O2]